VLCLNKIPVLGIFCLLLVLLSAPTWAVNRSDWKRFSFELEGGRLAIQKRCTHTGEHWN
jgi:hypothetical protein